MLSDNPRFQVVKQANLDSWEPRVIHFLAKDLKEGREEGMWKTVEELNLDKENEGLL